MGALVLLLKSDVVLSRSGDSYHAVLSEHGYSPLSIAVIDHSLVDMDWLRDIVCSGSMRYEGVIFTSGRAVDAWIEAVSMVSEEQLSGSRTETTLDGHAEALVRKLVVYVLLRCWSENI